MREYFKKIDKKNRTLIISIIAIVAFGFFLRSYHFSDWLRFNADQSRDVALAISSIENNALPLFGPKAGGTEFKLGPTFYYFQIVSMKIFGSTPQAGAYPDLIFSSLAIIVFFLIARVFFSQKITLALVWLYAISYFAVKYSRFAWNPNSTPFFVMLYLYSFYKLAAAKEGKKTPWAILTGFSLGIAVQLHTSLLIILPVLTIIALVFVVKKNLLKKTAIVWLLGIAIFVNAPQIIGEVKNRGFNSYQFFLGATSKSERNSSLGRNIVMNLSCHIKADGHIISSLGNEDSCDYKEVFKKFKKLDGKKLSVADKASFVLFFAIALLFALGGYALFFLDAKREADKKRKMLLWLTGAYVALFFLFSITWATELSVRFFLPLVFVPFLLLGFWLKFLSEKTKKELIVVLAAVIVLTFSNFQKIYGSYKDMRFGGREINGDFDYMTLGEGKYISAFIKNNSGGEKAIYIDAQAGYLFKFIKSLRFLAKENEIEIIQLEEGINLAPGSRLFYIKNADSKCQLPEKTLRKYEIENCASHGQFSIFALKVE